MRQLLECGSPLPLFGGCVPCPKQRADQSASTAGSLLATLRSFVPRKSASGEIQLFMLRGPGCLVVPNTR